MGTLIGFVDQDVTEFILWPKLAAKLFSMSAKSTEKHVGTTVEAILNPRVLTKEWKLLIDSTLEGAAVRVTLELAFPKHIMYELHWTVYFKNNIRRILRLLSTDWLIPVSHEMELLGPVQSLSASQLEELFDLLTMSRKWEKNSNTPRHISIFQGYYIPPPHAVKLIPYAPTFRSLGTTDHRRMR